MATSKVKYDSKKGNRRPKPISHAPGLTRTRRKYGCGGALKKSK